MRQHKLAKNYDWFYCSLSYMHISLLFYSVGTYTVTITDGTLDLKCLYGS
jgi:hypothetical protein